MRKLIEKAKAEMAELGIKCELYTLREGVIGALSHEEDKPCRIYYRCSFHELRWPRQASRPNDVRFISLVTDPSKGSRLLQLRQFAADKLVQVTKWPEPKLIESEAS